MRVMLDAHPRICCGPELKLLPSIAEWYQTLTRNFASVLQSYGNTPADLRLRFRQLIEGLVENFRRASGKPRWAEKTPHNVLFMVPLGELFPEARFIHLIRDGRDVACSLITMDWLNPLTGRKLDYVQNIASAARYWREVVTVARQQAQHPTLAGRVRELRYEALVANPEGVMRQVLQFLGEPLGRRGAGPPQERSQPGADRSQHAPGRQADQQQLHRPVARGDVPIRPVDFPGRGRSVAAGTGLRLKHLVTWSGRSRDGLVSPDGRVSQGVRKRTFPSPGWNET